MKVISGPNYISQDTHPTELLLPQGIHVSQNQVWENWGRTARCQPEFSFFPQHVEDLVQIVHFAHERDKQVRVVASGHSWSELVPTDGILVYVHGLNKVEMDLSDDTNPRVTIESGATGRAPGLWSGLVASLISTNLFFGFGGFLPLPSVDGEVIWRELLRPIYARMQTKNVSSKTETPQERE